MVGSQQELLDVALPYVDAGLRSGDLVVLACPPESAALISGALGERAAEVESDPRITLLGNQAPDALSVCQRYLDRSPGSRSGRLRVLADVDFGTDPAGWREGQRFESVFNRLLGGAPACC